MPIPPPERSGYTVSTDVPLYWCTYGREGAPRLVVLHGGPGAHHDYLLPQFLALADEYELFFYDQRGGGRSRTTHAAAITWETQVGDLARVVQESASTPLSLVGYSWGGVLALLYGIQAAARRTAPEPARLVLVDPAPISRRYRATFEEEFARRQRAPAVQAMRDALTQSGLRDSDPDAFRQRSFELSVAGYFADPRVASNLTPFRVMGRVQDAKDVLRRLNERAATRYVSLVARAALHGAVGERDAGVKLLQQAFDARELLMIGAAPKPDLKALLVDPRAQRIVDQANAIWKRRAAGPR